MKKWALLLMFLGQAMDIFSSMLSGGQEMNPFMRTEKHLPILPRLFAVKVLYFGPIALACLVAYLQLKKWSQVAADMFVVAVCLYYACDIFPIVTQNLMIHWGWYQP